MFDARQSTSGEYDYLIEVERIRDAEDEYRYMANVAQIVRRTTGDRIAHHPQLHRHYGLTPEEAIEKAFDEAESVRKPLGRFARVIQDARLLFDSHLAAARAGLRAAKPGSRMLVYASDDYLIDVQLQSKSARGDTVMLGQITSAQTPNPQVEGSRVVLERDTREIARGVTNQLGEFELEFDGPASDLSLTFVLAQCQVVVRLGTLTRSPA
jgi:hypothetical protein